MLESYNVKQDKKARGNFRCQERSKDLGQKKKKKIRRENKIYDFLELTVQQKNKK